MPPPAADGSSHGDTELDNVQRVILEHGVLNIMSSSKPSPHGSGNSVEEETEQIQEQERMNSTKETASSRHCLYVLMHVRTHRDCGSMHRHQQ